MKKIYLLAAGLILCGSIIGQSALNVPDNNTLQRAQKPANAKPPVSSSTGSSRTLGTKYWIDPVGAVMASKLIDLPGGTTGGSDAEGYFLDITYEDSTVTVSSPPSSTTPVSSILLGSILDPTSSYLDPTLSFTPIMTKLESYSIDSLQIVGSYVKIDPSVTDTLYTWLVWGDTTNTSVWTKKRDNAVWVAPIGNWRYSVIGAAITGATGGPGNKAKPSAPASNKMLVKYVLTSADEASGPGSSNVISIALPTIANIPAGNIVSCFYTFVPGGAHVTGDCSYSFTNAPVAQTVNGFGGLIWGQTTPAVTALADYRDQQVDPDGWNMGATYSKRQRHITTLLSSARMNGDLVTAPLIYYSVYTNTSVGVNETNNNFSLGQNTPNPFTNQTKIDYKIKTSAKNVSLVIYDVAGVKLFEKTQSNISSGNYSVDVNDVNFASGIYFYSLTVDGNKITKKMVVAK